MSTGCSRNSRALRRDWQLQDCGSLQPRKGKYGPAAFVKTVTGSRILRIQQFAHTCKGSALWTGTMGDVAIAHRSLTPVILGHSWRWKDVSSRFNFGMKLQNAMLVNMGPVTRHQGVSSLRQCCHFEICKRGVQDGERRGWPPEILCSKMLSMRHSWNVHSRKPIRYETSCRPKNTGPRTSLYRLRSR